MLALVLLVILEALSTAAVDICKTGQSNVKDIDLHKLSKTWKWLYVDNKDLTAQYSCIEVDVISSADGGLSAHAVTSLTRNSDGRCYSFLGTMKKLDGNSLNVTTPENNEWSNVYNLLAIGKRYDYAIAGSCLRVIDRKPVTIIAFPTWTPCEDTLNAAKMALSEMGYDFKDFKMLCPRKQLRLLNRMPHSDLYKCKSMNEPSSGYAMMSMHGHQSRPEVSKTRIVIRDPDAARRTQCAVEKGERLVPHQMGAVSEGLRQRSHVYK
ncbi:uncharacterized protein [Periplaneta americana]|uniref:uncharacterized protein n=1 Tax=Periplaneta americana TaxID=6978 RepID=UPI0037E8BEE8